jgi:antitoxin VapB
MATRQKRARATKAPERRAKVFWTGRSQAVRLPKEFRFAAEEVAIRREGERVILEPVSIPRDAKGWPLVLWELMGADPTFDVGDRKPDRPRDPFEDED